MAGLTHAPIPTKSEALPRVLGTRDLVLMNIAAIVALRWLATAAKLGPSSLALWILGLIIFFVPIALVVLELNARLPGEGGLYLWTREAFGDFHGFVAGWTYWISNLVFFPSLLLFAAGVTIYVAGDRWVGSAESTLYNALFALTTLWGVTLLNIVGLRRAKWLQNLGGIATWTAAALILIAGAYAAGRFGPATAITRANLMPDLTGLATLSTLATIALAYQGFELGPILGGEIQNPTRQIPRAMLISGLVIAGIYLAGTASLLVALPSAQIDLIGGIPQAMVAIGDRLGLPIFGPLAAMLIALGSLGGIGAWMTGTARLPYVVGVDRHLPRALSAIHPEFGTPHVALLTQATLTTLILWGALSRSTIHEAFVILLDMTVILGFIPLLYMFASLPVIARRHGGTTILRWAACVAGFGTTLLAIATSLIPPAETSSARLFVFKVAGGSVALIGAGLLFYLRGRRQEGVPRGDQKLAS